MTSSARGKIDGKIDRVVIVVGVAVIVALVVVWWIGSPEVMEMLP